MSWLSDLISGGNNAAAQQAQQQTALMEQQQAAHDSAVTQGADSITQAFSQFDPAYYQGVSTAYDNTYNPQLTDQYNIAKDQLTAQLAGNDQLESSVGANADAQLQKTYNDNQTNIANQGQDAANAMKSTVSNDENNLFNLNATAANPLQAASMAQSTAGSIVAPNSQPSLGNVFAGALAPLAAGAKANQQSMAPIQQQQNAAPLDSGSSGGYFS